MTRHRRRPMYYHVTCLRDGTILAAYPVRKPPQHVLKRDRRQIDEDSVCAEFDRSGEELRDPNYAGRTRFQDIIANALNVRRAIRELVLPKLLELESQVSELRARLDKANLS